MTYDLEKEEKEIRAESLEFVQKNKGMKIDETARRAHGYTSPRISSEFMDCSMPMTFDNYSHCSLGCTYCFAYMFKSMNISFNEKLHSVDADKMCKAIQGKPETARQKELHKHFYSKRFLIHWGGLADPFCNFEKANHNSYQIIQTLASEAYPTLFSFKGSAIWKPHFQQLFKKYANQKNFAFQVSIIAPSDEMSRKIEIGVPITSRRIDAIKMLSDMGYYTILRLRPFIIGITDDGLDELLERCKEAGIQGVSMEFVALSAYSKESLMKRYRWIGKMIGVSDMMEYFSTLSPGERGTYWRLNRMVKEIHVKKVYQFCVENDILFACSDPDFKELNMSGSCCGMPDKYPENPELCNWTKNQLSFAIKEARREYHKSGRRVRFRFDKVFQPKEDTYLLSEMFGQDHPSVAQKTASERRKITYKDFAQNTWNNLRSPSNPRNYFHYKLKPITTDENGNLVYIYLPSDYESRWKAEGIDLTK